MHGQAVMDAIFGRMERPELFSPLNGMIISDLVETKFDNGFMVIVPDLPDDPIILKAQIQLWNSSEPKNYKIRILASESPETQEYIHSSSQETWRDLDNKKVEFRSDFRPRARYFYFHYCIQILRRAWKAEKKGAEQLKQEFGKGYWGTMGPYLQESMLRAFIEELGHEYNELLVAGTQNNRSTTDDEDNLLLAVASSQVKASENDLDEDQNSDEEVDDSD